MYDITLYPYINFCMCQLKHNAYYFLQRAAWNRTQLRIPEGSANCKRSFPQEAGTDRGSRAHPVDFTADLESDGVRCAGIPQTNWINSRGVGQKTY